MTINRNISDLHPKMQGPVSSLADKLLLGYKAGITQTEFKLFEGFRDPSRQRELLKAKTTKAGPWQSAHQFGLAADFVAWVNGRWSWSTEHDWNYLHECAEALGLGAPIKWDLPHIQHPFWPRLQTFLRPDTK